MRVIETSDFKEHIFLMLMSCILVGNVDVPYRGENFGMSSAAHTVLYISL